MGNLTYEYDGYGWNLMATGGPGQRGYTTLAFDRSRSEMVVFGGQRGAGELGDTWTWNGVQWKQLLEMTQAGDPVLVAAGNVNRCHEYSNGAWLLRSGPDTEIADLATVPLRGDVFGVGYGHEAIYSTTLARCETVGQACTSERFELTATGVPFLGNAGFRVDADGAQGFALFGFSFVPAQIPLGNGCTSYLGSAIAAGFVPSNAYGIASLPVPVPLIAALRGVRLRLQAAGPRSAGPTAGWRSRPAST
ncbi:MAG: hypothetical protein U1E73_00920 [Planctomycetota bacterium]